MPPKLDAWISYRSKDKGVLKSAYARKEALVRTQLKIMDIGPPLVDLYSGLATLDSPGVGMRCAAYPPFISQSAGISNRRSPSTSSNRLPPVSRVEVIRQDFRREGF
jgi:hypothetical protein